MEGMGLTFIAPKKNGRDFRRALRSYMQQSRY